MYSIERTILFTDLTSYAADLAHILDGLTEIFVLATYYYTIFIRNEFYYGFWTFFDAFAARGAFFLIDNRNSVYYFNGIKIAYCNTVSITQAPFIASLVSALDRSCRLAVFYSMIFMFFG